MTQELPKSDERQLIAQALLVVSRRVVMGDESQREVAEYLAEVLLTASTPETQTGSSPDTLPPKTTS